MTTFNSCTECVRRPGIIQDRTPDCDLVSWAWMHVRPNKYAQLSFPSYVGHWCGWLIFWDAIHGCFYQQALADVRSTGAGIKCLYCNRLVPCTCLLHGLVLNLRFVLSSKIDWECTWRFSIHYVIQCINDELSFLKCLTEYISYLEDIRFFTRTRRGLWVESWRGQCHWFCCCFPWYSCLFHHWWIQP